MALNGSAQLHTLDHVAKLSGDTTDIVERLRAEAADVPIRLALDAADEIERLRAALARIDDPPLKRGRGRPAKVAQEQPEFEPKRGPGRPPGIEGKVDKELLNLIQTVTKERILIKMGTGEQPEDFETILKAVVEEAMKRDKLKRHVDRTTHPKRLRRYWKRRRQNDTSMAHALMYGSWDK
jgi:hypothetical protein